LLSAHTKHTVEHIDPHLSVVHDLLQAECPSTVIISTSIYISQQIAQFAPPTSAKCILITGSLKEWVRGGAVLT
jgi:hypothetical protein